MAVDEALLRSCAEGGSPPVVRFYGWAPWALSIGAHQDARRAADGEWLRRNGIDLVRRPTGGRAVLHARELTYCVAAPSERGPGGITEVYRLVAEALLAGLESLGVGATLTRGRPSRKAGEALRPCFTSPARYEILWRGRKLVGSAQRQVDGAFLQHGSIPFEPDEERVRLATGNRDLPGGWMAGLEEGTGRAVSMEEAALALQEGFRTVFGPCCEEGGLTAAEAREAERLRNSKYATREWTLERRVPAPGGPAP